MKYKLFCCALCRNLLKPLVNSLEGDKFPRTVRSPCRFQLPTNSSIKVWITGRNMTCRQKRSSSLSGSSNCLRSSPLKYEIYFVKSYTDVILYQMEFTRTMIGIHAPRHCTHQPITAQFFDYGLNVPLICYLG